MPSLNIDVSAVPHADGHRVHVWVNEKKLPSIGPFASDAEAERAASRIIAEVRRLAEPVLVATMASDVSDEAYALMGR